MKETETQRNFKKQMEQARRAKILKDDSYNQYSYRERRPQEQNSFVGWAIAVFLLIFIVLGCMYPGDKNNSYQVSLLPFPENGQKYVPTVESSYLQYLKAQQEKINDVMENINAHHQQPWDSRDIEKYEEDLSSGIVVCSKVGAALRDRTFPPDLYNLAELTCGRIDDTYYALLYYYSSLKETGHFKNDYIEKGNYSLEEARKKSDMYMQELENYLQNNGYKYSRTESEIRYWYRL